MYDPSVAVTAPLWLRQFRWHTWASRLRLDDAPIILGPWRGEVGFEVLYWLPFLRRFVEKYQIDPSRLITIARGGSACWYPGSQSIDLYTLRELSDVRVQAISEYIDSHSIKQARVSAWDRQVVKDAAQRLGITRYHMLHPVHMYRVLAPFWDDKASLHHLEVNADYHPLVVPDLPDGVELPQDFCAVKFYARPTFMPSPSLLQFVTKSVEVLSKDMPCVLLNQDHHFDDHTDIPLTGPNIIKLPLLAPERSIEVQAAVMARARAFVGTYGGVAQMALRYRKPSVSYYTHIEGTAPAHLTLSQRLAVMMGVSFEAHRVGPVSLGEQLKKAMAA